MEEYNKNINYKGMFLRDGTNENKKLLKNGDIIPT